jgi:hypothetical protein
MPELNQRPKITVEDLLRLKRAERPAAEFWNGFERELRQKQLTALLNRGPWWQGLSQLLARRAYLPLGATAVIAFTLISVRQWAPPPVVQNGRAVPSSTARLDPKSAPVDPTFVAAVPSSSLANHTAVSAPLAAGSATAAAPSAPASATVSHVELATLVPSSHEFESPSARSIAANFARLEQSEPELISAVLGSRLSSPARVQTVALEDADMAGSMASKRVRLLARYHDRTTNPEPSPAPDLVRERLARRLGDSEIYERISRVGLQGSEVSLKF